MEIIRYVSSQVILCNANDVVSRGELQPIPTPRSNVSRMCERAAAKLAVRL